jgi:hypothetical protein
MTDPRPVRRVSDPNSPRPPGGTGSPTPPLAALLGPVADVLDLAADAVPALAVLTARVWRARRRGVLAVGRNPDSRLRY